MFRVSKIVSFLANKPTLKRTPHTLVASKLSRNLSSSTNGTKKPKDLTQAQGTENEERVRVRRARTSDVARVMRFVQEHCRATWPGLAPTRALTLVLNDYVARSLAQGHSMVAELQYPRRGWSQVRGLALSTALCPWDAGLVEKWARCVKCADARHLMTFTAHCLRAPGLHDKYNLKRILQIMLMVPANIPNNAEIVQMLAQHAIKRGRDVGFPLLRFDVTDPAMAEALENLKLVKEWEGSYNILPGKFEEPPIKKFLGNPEPLTEPASSGNIPGTYNLSFTTKTLSKIDTEEDAEPPLYDIVTSKDDSQIGKQDETKKNFSNYVAVFSVCTKLHVANVL